MVPKCKHAHLSLCFCHLENLFSLHSGPVYSESASPAMCQSHMFIWQSKQHTLCRPTWEAPNFFRESMVIIQVKSCNNCRSLPCIKKCACSNKSWCVPSTTLASQRERSHKSLMARRQFYCSSNSPASQQQKPQRCSPATVARLLGNTLVPAPSNRPVWPDWLIAKGVCVWGGVTIVLIVTDSLRLKCCPAVKFSARDRCVQPPH